MRNKVIIFIKIGIVLVVTVGVVIMPYSSKMQTNVNPSDIGDFSLADYQWPIENFPSDKNVGPIEDANMAIERAKELWIEKYSIVAGRPYNPINGLKIEVAYDTNAECWLMNGTVPPNRLGGVPYAIIHKDGKVIAVWHDD